MKRNFFVFIVILCLFCRTQLVTAQTTDSNVVQLTNESSAILCLSENSDSSLLAVSYENSVVVMNPQDFSPVCVIEEEKAEKTSFYKEGNSEYLSIMTSSGMFSVRKITKDENGWIYDPDEPYFSVDCSDSKGRRKINAMAFSRNSDFIAVAFNDFSVQVHFRLRITQSSITRKIIEHKTPVYGMEFSGNGEYLATVSEDGEAYIWNTSNSTKVTQLKGVYARSRVPVYFTEDSVYIVSTDGRNSFKISDFAGNTLYSIMTGRAITGIKPLKDPDLIAVRNDKNEVMIYSISSRRPLSVVNVESENLFSAYEFTPYGDLMYAGFKNGSLQIVEPQPYLEESEMLVTDSSLVGTGGGSGSGKGSHSPFASFSVCAGVNYLPQPYLLSGNLRVEYLYSQKISPFFVGGGLTFSTGFPRNDFPASYKLKGEYIKPPYLTSAALYVPAGYAFALKKGISVLTSFKLGVKVSSLAIIDSGNYIIGDPALSFFASAGAGMQIKFFEFDINCEYDTMSKVSPSVYLGYVKRWGEN